MIVGNQCGVVVESGLELLLENIISCSNAFRVEITIFNHEQCVLTSTSHDVGGNFVICIRQKVNIYVVSKHFHTSSPHNLACKICIAFCFMPFMHLHSIALMIYFAHESIGRERRKSREADMHIDGRSRNEVKSITSNRSVNSTFFIVNLHFSH